MPAAQLTRSPLEAANPATLLVLGSDPGVRQLVERAVQRYPLHPNLRVIFSDELRFAPADPPPEVVLINLTGPGESGLRLLPKIQCCWPNARLIFLSQSDDIHLWAETIQRGAYEFLPRSIEWHQLAWILQGAFWTRSTPGTRPSFPPV